MNKRELQKINTRKKILNFAKEEFILNGFVKAKTSDIAKRANIAHGTLFLHFENKELLILEIFDIELEKITTKLHQILNQSYELNELLFKYLDFIEAEEDFFSIISKEFPDYPEVLKRQIIFREAAIKNYFYRSIDEGITKGIYKSMDITYALSFLFGCINYFLANKDIFVNSGESVIRTKKKHIIETYLIFIRK